MHIYIYYFTHLGLFALQISSYCVQNTLFVDKQQQNGDSTTSSYDQKLKMSKVSLTTLQAVNVSYLLYGLKSTIASIGLVHIFDQYISPNGFMYSADADFFGVVFFCRMLCK